MIGPPTEADFLASQDQSGGWWGNNSDWMIPLIGGIGWGAQNYATSQLNQTNVTSSNSWNPFGNGGLKLPTVKTEVGLPVWIPIIAVLAIVVYLFKK